MYIVATYRYSKNIEMAIADLESMGLANNQILILPLDKRNDQTQIFDTIYESNGQTYVDIAAILGMIFMLLGGIYGFVLKWGPIIWGLIGLVTGAMAGFIIRYLYNKAQIKNKGKSFTTDTEIVMIIKCHNLQEEKIKKVIWNNSALGVATYQNQ